jgi:hypothetical protein
MNIKNKKQAVEIESDICIYIYMGKREWINHSRFFSFFLNQ